MKEIERKFLVTGDFSKEIIRSERFVQGYICSQPGGKTVRVRLAGEKGFLTIKGPSDDKGLSRFEFEKEITRAEAEELFQLCEPGAIEKVRHWVKEGDHTWEVDVFQGANEGLILAELELQTEDEAFALPAWIGREVTGDRRYYNSMLSQYPYTRWQENV
ncbi:CYTH domain-containing protein [Parabacteroides sp. PF5-6]|uniref:CYTH domain-containing protein n=1 Tax=Parabacteroides sp. PF5-6 TaxID=1742403 RepID=UPI0024056E1D|nr:CYTH domain-containing protein [Parabacteroides sp. PF5-6]MDF9829991.1 adenylate cyclase [Parabacteroides sp. PF5-6]